MNEFLNPKSMVTPGVAGSVVMFLSNAVCFQFPEIAPRWAALGLSFLLALCVMVAAKQKLLPGAGFWVVNSLIIFSVAVGSAGVAAKAGSQTANGAAAAMNFLVLSAYAQDSGGHRPVAPPTAAAQTAALQAQLDAAKARVAQQEAQLATAQQAAAAATAEAQKAQADRDALAALRAQEAQDKDKTAKNKQRFFKQW